jgi:RHS repeat-associated protein
LGSVVAMTDENGALLNEQRYLPFGQVRPDVGSVTQTDFGYTGQRDLDAQNNAFSLGLMDYDARFYDVSLSRFTQPDTVVPGAGNPQAFNHYSYTMNSPVNFIDPSGHYGICPGTITPTDDGYCGYAGYVAKETPTIPIDPSSTNINGNDILDNSGQGRGNICSENDLNCILEPTNTKSQVFTNINILKDSSSQTENDPVNYPEFLVGWFVLGVGQTTILAGAAIYGFGVVVFASGGLFHGAEIMIGGLTIMGGGGFLDYAGIYAIADSGVFPGFDISDIPH